MKTLVLAAVGLLAGTVAANAQLVYNNGPVNGTLSAWTIDDGYVASDSFVVSSPVTLGKADVGLWAWVGSTPLTLKWSIGTTPYGNNVSSGTGSLTNTFLGKNAKGFDLYESSFAIAGSLTDGTYYLTLDDTANSNNYPIYWDISNGPSVAFENTLGDVAKNLFAGSNSESFQLYGSGSVSERYPTLILLGFSCLLLLAGARWTAETARNT